MNTQIAPDGKITISRPVSKAGDKIVLRALVDCVLGISACSVSECDTNSGNCTSTADEYVAFCGTHCDHIVIPEPYRSKFFDGLRETVLEAGNKVVFNDTFILFLAKKPL